MSEKLSVILLALGLVTASSARARGQESDAGDDDDLADLQQALAADAAEAKANGPAPPATVTTGGGAAQSLNPDISFIVDVAGAWFSEDQNLQSGDHDPNENGFNLQQVEMAIASAVDPYFRVDGNFVLSQEGIEIEAIYATTLALPYNLQARIGQFLTRFGRINETHPHTWDFVDQPFILSRYFGGEGNRGLGTEISYLTPLPWYVELVASVTDPRGEGSARSFYGATDTTIDSPIDFQETLAAKQFFDLSDDLSLMWGLSAALGPNGTEDGARTGIYGTDVYLKYRPITRQSYTIVSLQAEWLYRRRDIVADTLWDHGGYAQLFWRFDKRWGTAARWEYGAAARGAGAAGLGDDLDPDWAAGRQRYTANITFWPTEFSRLRLQGSVDRPRWRPDPIVAGFLAFEFAVGAHGAHQF